MINMTVIDLRKIAKLTKMIICVFIIILFCYKINLNDKLIYFVGNKCEKKIENMLLISSYYDRKVDKKKSYLNKILDMELIISKTEKEFKDEKKEEAIDYKIGIVENEELIEESEKVEVFINYNEIETKILKEKNIQDTYTNIYNTVKIKNESKYNLTEEILNPDYEIKNKNIIIYHTHTCESYTPTSENNYVASGNFRTLDLNYSVVRVGDELTNHLTNFGFSVKHSKEFHDYPAYTGSYTRSLKTVNSLNSSTDELIIDLHRDALGSNSSYAPRVQIGDDIAAQVMFVIGTDGGGLEHSNWKNNLKMAVKIQEKANQMYPGLFRAIIVRNSRYNQHVSNGACIIEVGATGNTLEECNISMKYLAEVLNETIK